MRSQHQFGIIGRTAFAGSLCFLFACAKTDSATSDLLPDALPSVPAIQLPLPSALTMAGTTPTGSSVCTPVTVTILDDQPVPAPIVAPVDAPVSLGSSGGGLFFSDAICTNNISQATVSTGQSSVGVYFRDSAVGSQTLSAGTIGLTSATLDVTVEYNAPSALQMAGASAIAIYSCVPYTVSLRDSLSQATVAPADVTVNLGATGGSFYTANDCGTTASSALIATGQSQVTVYFSTLSAGAVTVSADSSGLASASKNLTVNSEPPSKFRLTGPAAINTTQCAAYAITTVDSHDVVASLGSDTTVDLTGAGTNGNFYSNIGCSSLITQTAMLATTSSKTVYYKQTAQTAPITLMASSAGYTSGTVGVSLSSGTASMVELLSAGGLSFITTDCIAMSVQTKDAGGNVVAVSSNTSVSLATSNGGSFYTTNTCATTASSVTITSGTFSKSFWYKKTNTGVTALTASSTGKAPSSLSFTITAAPPTKLVFGTGGTPIASAACQGYTVTSQDTNSNASVISASVATALGLSDASAGGVFYSNNTCTTIITTVSIPAAASVTPTFYYKKTGQASLTLTASLTGLTAATKAVVVSSGVPKKIVLISPVTTGLQSACVAYNMRLQDEQSIAVNTATAVTVNLAGISDGAFYSNNTCTVANVITSKNFNIGQGAASIAIYYKKPTTGAVTLTLTDNAATLTAASQALTISSGTVTKVAFTTAPTSITINTCNAYVVQFRDENNQNVNTLVSRDVDLSTTGTGGAFYPANTCAGGAEITTTTIAAAAGSKTIYYKKTTLGNVVLTAASTGITSATANVTLANVASALAFTSGPASLPAATCGTYVIKSVDTGGTPVNLSAAKTIALSGLTGDAQYFVDPACTLAITSTTIGSGANTATVYISGPDPGAFTLGASTSGLTSASYSIGIN